MTRWRNSATAPIGINAWTGMAFALTTWGAFPGNTAQDIGSGTGMVHNTFMLPRPQKAVVEIPFRPAPRSLFNGELTLSPKPVFFITNKTAETTARRLVRFLVHRNLIALPRIFLSALRGSATRLPNRRRSQNAQHTRRGRGVHPGRHIPGAPPV